MVIISRFNSIKVQLELRANTYKGAIIKFQFHKGAIRTQPSLRFTSLSLVSIP